MIATLMAKLQVLPQYLIPHHCLSRLIGWFAACRWHFIKTPFINFFAKAYQVDLQEAEIENLAEYKNFNQFFTRHLKPECRPVSPDSIVSPADGSISQIGSIEQDLILQAKGHYYNLWGLLGGDESMTKLFANGHFATIYLSPKDYHRVHMPLTGTLRKTVYVPGRLFSVNQLTTQHVPRVFARNERLIALFDTEVGPMAVIMVGAMIVAGIETIWSGLETPYKARIRHTNYLPENHPEITFETGAEIGHFKLGSTVILLFGENAINWSSGLEANTALKMGECLARLEAVS